MRRERRPLNDATMRSFRPHTTRVAAWVAPGDGEVHHRACRDWREDSGLQPPSEPHTAASLRGDAGSKQRAGDAQGACRALGPLVALDRGPPTVPSGDDHHTASHSSSRTPYRSLRCSHTALPGVADSFLARQTNSM